MGDLLGEGLDASILGDRATVQTGLAQYRAVSKGIVIVDKLKLWSTQPSLQIWHQAVGLGPVRLHGSDPQQRGLIGRSADVGPPTVSFGADVLVVPVCAVGVRAAIARNQLDCT